jgi:hypothetical protein
MKKYLFIISALLSQLCSPQQVLYNYQYGNIISKEKPDECSFRSKQSIWEKIKPELRKMNKEYKKLPPEKKGNGGTIKFKFLLDARGNVMADTLVQSDFSDSLFVNAVRGIIIGIKFEDISKDHENDVTEITWPFRFK